MHDVITAVAPATPELRVEPRVHASADVPDRQQLILGILDLDLRVNGDVTGETLRVAREVLEHCGGSWRANKNAAILIAADIAGMSKARGSATLSALRERTSTSHGRDSRTTRHDAPWTSSHTAARHGQAAGGHAGQIDLVRQWVDDLREVTHPLGHSFFV